MDLHAILAGKWEDGTRPADLFARFVEPAPAHFVEAIASGLGSRDARVRNGCAELASLLSATRPDLLYPSVGLFLDNLDSRAKVVRWEAVCTLGNLARADRDARVPPAIPRLAACLEDESIVLRNHAAHALAKVAAAFPEAAPGILDSLLAAEGRFVRNHVGFLVEVMPVFLGMPATRGRARAFAEKHVTSEVAVVARKARAVLRGA